MTPESIDAMEAAVESMRLVVEERRRAEREELEKVNV